MKSGSQPENRNITIILPKIFSGTSKLRTGISTKMGSESDTPFGVNMSYTVGDDPIHVEKNRRKFFAQVGVSETKLAIPIQCHSNTVLRVDAPGEYKDCDALMTDSTQVALVVAVADCVPLLLFDPVKKAVGAVHAGWKGTSNMIVKHAVEKMNTEFGSDPAHIFAYIGPSAGVCCYEVGEEVAIKFGNKVVPCSTKKFFLDLKKENLFQLQQLGVLAGNIEVSSSCTICEKDMFHSFRRDGKRAGRMIAVISMID